MKKKRCDKCGAEIFATCTVALNKKVIAQVCENCARNLYELLLGEGITGAVKIEKRS